jgi:hypothetical protein
VKAEGRPQAASDPNIPLQKIARGHRADEISVRRALRERFGPPRTYGLTVGELEEHIRHCRRAGWLQWEIRVRFGQRAA